MVVVQLFFLKKISKANSQKAREVQPKYTESIQEKIIQQDQEWRKRAQKSTKLEILRRTLTEIHSKSDLRKHICSSELVFSQSSKLQAFPSFQMHHLKQGGIIF
jgi:hypothetical protein